ncbi:SulP family inorganic anion transporter [Verrucomicrobiaceae bacterium 5K15]|uniref:SulP family inorganic anion transporter n=1 Tax=Oceaniferula flava TaxID=2800421 RepID=A0AAE2SBY8_9BACT|nr:SulP family inorganic anion transporter [Oceaniferula flavus]MBK1854124.1 SulP family inorganic anion transporter [Oceaniferula flavus]MBM1135430.1 SulP family inorganic anion transporter [Oceaniferula flavus]
MKRHLKAVLRNTLHGAQRILSGNGLDLFPIRGPIKRYNRKKFSYDAKAALNTALLALPQGMAYAAIAELPIHYGILSSAICAIVAPFFASSRFTILGPTNSTAFMVFSFFAAASGTLGKAPVEYMPLLVLMVGVLSVIGAVFKVADLLQYVSRSVLVGYITGAALLILTNQLKHVLGIAEPMSQGASASTFFAIIEKIGALWDSYQWQPMLLGGLTLTLYLALQKKFSTLPNFAISLAVSAVTGWALKQYVAGFENISTFTPLHLDHLVLRMPDINMEDISTLMAVAFAVAFLASLENSVMAKSLASRSGDRTDVNQDMLSVGMSNIATSFLAAMPSSGSLTRSALNYESQAKSRFASIFCGLLCLAGFYVMVKLPVVENIPKTSLAALVIGIAISLFKWKNIRICLRSTPDDALVIITTFAATLLTRLDYAIFIGVGLSITLFLRKASKPHLVEYEINDEGSLQELDAKNKRQIPAISIVHVEGDLFFGAADLFLTQIQRTIADDNLKCIILRLKNARHLDATSVLALDELIKDTRKKGVHVLVSGATREVYEVLKKSGVLQTLQQGCIREEGETNLFMYFRGNPNISTRDALIRAQQLIGTKDADIKIFFDPNKEKEGK